MINTKPIYSFLESITFGHGLHKTVNGVRMKLPAKYIRHYPTDFKKENFAFFKSCCGEGATILDIGAHIGLFSVLAAKTAGEYGKIFSFEPAFTTIPVLQQTIRINELGSSITPVNQAMGKDVRRADFFVSTNEADNGNSLISYKQDRKLTRVEVDMNTIDNFVMTKKLAKINFIKIDVEGAEYDTLLGGQQVFKKYKPHVIVSIHPEAIEKKGDKLEDIFSLVEDMRYDIICSGKLISKEQFCNNRELIDLHLLPR